jgi:hypothetical protein
MHFTWNSRHSEPYLPINEDEKKQIETSEGTPLIDRVFSPLPPNFYSDIEAARPRTANPLREADDPHQPRIRNCCRKCGDFLYNLMYLIFLLLIIVLTCVSISIIVGNEIAQWRNLETWRVIVWILEFLLWSPACLYFMKSQSSWEINSPAQISW